MASRLKPSSAQAHSARSTCCSPAHMHARPARRGPAASSRSPPASEAGPGAVPRRCGAHAGPRVGARAARVLAGGARTAPHRGASTGEWLQHEPQQGLQHEHPRCMANPPDKARRTYSQLGRQATRKWMLTSAVDGAEAQRQ
jgi:hypothetical protein